MHIHSLWSEKLIKLLCDDDEWNLEYLVTRTQAFFPAFQCCTLRVQRKQFDLEAQDSVALPTEC